MFSSIHQLAISFSLRCLSKPNYLQRVLYDLDYLNCRIAIKILWKKKQGLPHISGSFKAKKNNKVESKERKVEGYLNQSIDHFNNLTSAY